MEAVMTRPVGKTKAQKVYEKGVIMANEKLKSFI